MKLTLTHRALHPRHAFGISRGVKTEVCNVFVRLEQDGIAGYGEASPNAFYAETADNVAARLEAARGFVESMKLRSVRDLETAWEEAWPLVSPSRAAQCALDLAAWDWLARRQGVSVAELAWGTPPAAVPTFCTVGISSAEELALKVDELREFPRIKIKSSSGADLEALRLVRQRSTALLAVDANCAWQPAEIAGRAEELKRGGVAFLEQPLPPDQDTRLLRGQSPLPIFADESCVTEAGVERIAPHFDGFNLKLVKCGGLTPARRMVERGRALGLKIMVGCMLESSALIAAGAVIAQRTDYADLDGAWLLADDPFRGWGFERGVLLPPGGDGLGAVPQPGMF